MRLRDTFIHHDTLSRGVYNAIGKVVSIVYDNDSFCFSNAIGTTNVSVFIQNGGMNITIQGRQIFN